MHTSPRHTCTHHLHRHVYSNSIIHTYTRTQEGPKENPGVNFRALAELFRVSKERQEDHKVSTRTDTCTRMHIHINSLSCVVYEHTLPLFCYVLWCCGVVVLFFPVTIKANGRTESIDECSIAEENVVFFCVLLSTHSICVVESVPSLLLYSSLPSTSHLHLPFSLPLFLSPPFISLPPVIFPPQTHPQVTINVSVLEIYNDQVHDLLIPAAKVHALCNTRTHPRTPLH